jgi:hypothetical protein
MFDTDKTLPEISSLHNKNCITVLDMGEDLYELINKINSKLIIDRNSLITKCNKIEYPNGDLTQNIINETFASEICKLYGLISSETNIENIFNYDIRNFFNIPNCLSTYKDSECNSSTRPVITFKNLIQAIIDKLEEQCQ